LRRGTAGIGIIIALGLIVWALLRPDTPEPNQSSGFATPGAIPTDLNGGKFAIVPVPFPVAVGGAQQLTPEELQKLAGQYSTADLQKLATQSEAALQRLASKYLGTASGKQALTGLLPQASGLNFGALGSADLTQLINSYLSAYSVPNVKTGGDGGGSTVQPNIPAQPPAGASGAQNTGASSQSSNGSNGFGLNGNNTWSQGLAKMQSDFSQMSNQLSQIKPIGQ
jgi:hypothetical protein